MTAIEWCRNADGSPGKTWNPIRARNKKTGKRGWHCEHVHEGCRGCYAERQNVKPGDSGGTGLAYKPGHRRYAEIYLDDKTLLAPLRWKKPQRIFVCSMTDLFGAWVLDRWLDNIFAIAALCPQHTFIVLTKRPERMRTYLTKPTIDGSSDRSANYAKSQMDTRTSVVLEIAGLARTAKIATLPNFKWPLPNLWGLVSCSTQEDANAFIPILLDTPLAKRGVSLEPLLGPIDLTAIDATGWDECFTGPASRGRLNALTGWCYGEDLQDDTWTDWCSDQGEVAHGWSKPNHRHIDWVIAGGESGKEARPMHPDWARSLQQQCAAAGVPFFFKQWGEWAPLNSHGDLSQGGRGRGPEHWFDTLGARRVGKTRAGRLLDGREHNAWPEAAA